MSREERLQAAMLYYAFPAGGVSESLSRSAALAARKDPRLRTETDLGLADWREAQEADFHAAFQSLYRLLKVGGACGGNGMREGEKNTQRGRSSPRWFWLFFLFFVFFLVLLEPALSPLPVLSPIYTYSTGWSLPIFLLQGADPDCALPRVRWRWAGLSAPRARLVVHRRLPQHSDQVRRG